MYEYEQDENKIIEAYKQKGFIITNEQATDIWSEYSDTLMASWLMLPDDSDILFKCSKEIAKKLKVIE